MTAERVNDSSANQYDNPFGDLPTYEEMLAQERREEPTTESEPVQQESETDNNSQERSIVSRQKLKSGERSAVYRLEMSDGKEGTEIQSDYLDICSEFKKQHEELKGNFDLNLSMGGFATDLAIIDATRGDCFTNGNAEERAALLQDYGKLRARYENPNTSMAEKQLLSEYFNQMQGSALDFVQQQYEQSQGMGEQNEKLKAELEELKAAVEKSRADFNENYQQFEKLYNTVREMIDQRYYDDAAIYLSRLLRVIEDAQDSAKKYQSNNNNYVDAVSKSRDQLDEETYNAGIKSYDRNDDTIRQALRNINNVDDEAHQLRRKLMDMGY